MLSDIAEVEEASIVKRLLLLTMILLLSVSLLMPDIYATTTNQQKSANTTNITNNSNIALNNSNTDKIQCKTVPRQPANAKVNDTVTKQSDPKVTASSVNTNENLKSDNKSTYNIQYAKKAAGNNAYSNVQGNWFVTNNLTEASGWVKTYIEVNHKLPKYVKIGNIQVSMPQFLELITKDLVQLNKGNNTPVKLGSINMPNNSSGNINNGTINKSEYLNLASKIQNFMDSTGRAPNYASITLGKIRYESLIYMYSRIMNYYGIQHVLPNGAAIKPLSSNNTTKTTNSSSNITGNGYTISQITTAAGSVKNYIEKNKKLPKYVQINTGQITLPQFLELLNNGLLQINGNKNTPITLKKTSNPINPNEDLKSGNINKSEYLNLATKIQNFMDSTGRAPNYASITLGKIRYESLIYLESRIMNFYGVKKVLPKYAVVNSWNGSSNGTTSTIPDSLKQYLKPTANAQSNNSNIKSLAASITNGLTSPYSKATAIFNWVRDHITYSFYYNTKYGALGTLSSRTGNCCDHSNLMVDLARAVGIPARYEQGYCEFSDGWFGHVWAQLYVNGKWYYADTISNRNNFGEINNWKTSNWTYVGTYAQLPF